jgi:hypothetical protein
MQTQNPAGQCVRFCSLGQLQDFDFFPAMGDPPHTRVDFTNETFAFMFKRREHLSRQRARVSFGENVMSFSNCLRSVPGPS